MSAVAVTCAVRRSNVWYRGWKQGIATRFPVVRFRTSYYMSSRWMHRDGGCEITGTCTFLQLSVRAETWRWLNPATVSVTTRRCLTRRTIFTKSVGSCPHHSWRAPLAETFIPWLISPAVSLYPNIGARSVYLLTCIYVLLKLQCHSLGEWLEVILGGFIRWRPLITVLPATIRNGHSAGKPAWNSFW